MDDDAATEAARLFAELLARSADRTATLERIYTALSERGLLSRVTVHRYMCTRGCQIATVFRVGSATLCAVRDFKYSPGKSEERTVVAAREKHTLDGDRWWPSRVYDVDELAAWDTGTTRAGVEMTCRHFLGTVQARDILTTAANVTPGHPNKPTRLSAAASQRVT